MLFRPLKATDNESKSALLDLKNTSSQNYQSTRIQIEEVLSETKKDRFKKNLTSLRKKRARKKILDFIEKHTWSLRCTIVLTTTGITFGLLWKFYYTALQDELSVLNQNIQDITIKYNITGCPGSQYWYHPEEAARCKERNSKGEDDYFIYLTTQQDYCLSSNCVSTFAVELIQKLLPSICVLIMEELCDGLEAYASKDSEGWSVTLITILPSIIISLFTLLLAQRAFRYASRLNRDEQTEAEKFIADIGLEHPGNDQYFLEYAVTNLGKAQEIVNRYNVYLPVLDSLFPNEQGILQIILGYANALLPKELELKRTAARRAAFLSPQKFPDNETENKCYLATFFRKLDTYENPVHYHRLNAKTYSIQHATNEEITEKIFAFAGLSK